MPGDDAPAQAVSSGRSQIAHRNSGHDGTPAGEAITHSQPDPMSAPWTGLGLFFGYAVIVLILAAVSLRRRDA